MLNRQKEFLQWLVGGLSTSALIVGTVWATENHQRVVAALTGERPLFAPTNPAADPSTEQRAPASVQESHVPTKTEVLEKHENEGSTTDHKGSGSLQLTLTSPDGRKSDGSLVLEAKIVSLMDLDAVKYEWVLPEGISLVSGSARGDIGSITEGAPSTLEVTLNVPSQLPGAISLHVYRDLGGEKLGQVVQYNAISQTTINTALALTRSALQTDSNSRKPASDQTDNRRME